MKYNCGIYKIENINTGKYYIGQSSDLYMRKIIHFRSLENNKSFNQYFQRAYNKYGKNSFIFSVLLYCEPFELTRYEQFFVDNGKREFLYNIRECVNSNKGIIRSIETKNKLSNSHKGEKNFLFGKHRSDETKEKISKSHIGKKHKKESKEKISKNHADVSGPKNPNFKKSMSKEQKDKISEALKKYHSAKDKEK